MLGLLLTPTTIGWVLADEQDADGATLACDEFAVPGYDAGSGAGEASTRAIAAVSRLRTMVEARGQRLRGIGVTWSDEAAAEAALLLESLTVAGFDNVVPVRFQQAVESLTRGMGPIAGSGQAAVCIIEPGSATVVVRDGCDDTPAVISRSVDDDDDLVDWLTTFFTADGRRPGLLVVAGSGAGLDTLAMRLGTELAVPVVAQAGVHLVLARGAALAVAVDAEFAGVQPDGMPAEPDVDHSRPVRARTLSYAGALTMLVAGVLTFVVSLSVALSVQLVPQREPYAVDGVANHAPATPSAVRRTTPATAPPANAPAPPVEVSHAPTALGSLSEDAPADGAAAAPAAPSAVPAPSGPRSLLNRALKHLPHPRGR